MLTNSDIADLIDFRRFLHRHPELSGQEEWTAIQITEALRALGPDRLSTGIGGHGVVAEWIGASTGPTVMFRAELDALPIAEASTFEHRSQADGKGHLCGHDGHMSILLGLARLISRNRPKTGRVALLFQPAEETGAGAASVIASPEFESFRTDWAFALHNMPGIAIGHAAVASGPANCASEGMRILLTGRTSHASAPERGISPAPAFAKMIPAFQYAGPGGETDKGFRLVSICHARMGEPAFGITPGQAELWLTLRTLLDADMDALRETITAIATAIALEHGLTVEFSSHERFAACSNDPEATRIIQESLKENGISFDANGLPMRASEDFGAFGHHSKSAMFLLGAGETAPMLHNPDYDFPDTLIRTGTNIFYGIYRRISL